MRVAGIFNPADSPIRLTFTRWPGLKSVGVDGVTFGAGAAGGVARGLLSLWRAVTNSSRSESDSNVMLGSERSSQCSWPAGGMPP